MSATATLSITDIVYCSKCGIMIIPSVPPPKCHQAHGGLGIFRHCNRCGITISDSQVAPPDHYKHMREDAQEIKQAQWNAMIKAEQEPQRTKTTEKKYVKTTGIFPHEETVVDERLALKMAKKGSSNGSDQQ